uniref:uncharacterized protein LOC120335757 isoform X3 n=1 Tax=Styela clava TaxID=7725 RepID=UPI0019393971|nr:uncharacterized protein LOC120335757 isoform X3 [Styela clava]
MRPIDNCNPTYCFKQMTTMDRDVIVDTSYLRKQKNERPCKCGNKVPWWQNDLRQNFRGVAIAIFLLFGLCILLFAWNIVLWRELDHLQHQVSTLSNELHQYKETTSSNHGVRDRNRLSRRRRERNHDWNDQTNKNRDIFVEDNDDNEDGEIQHRKKRSNADEDMEIGKMPMLSRIKRRTKGKKRGRKGQRIKRHLMFRPPLVRGRRFSNPQATAIHVRIKGTDPYQDEIIHSWDTNTNNGAIVQGFDVTEINLGEGEAGVRVMKDGIYFIYSQVVFKMNRGSEVTEKVMIGVTGNTELAACTNSLPRSHNPDDYITCYSSGIAFLSRGDKFRVKIYPPGMKVFMNPSHTYFGAFLLGEKKP